MLFEGVGVLHPDVSYGSITVIDKLMDTAQLIDDFLSACGTGADLSEDDPRNRSIWAVDRLAREDPDTAWLLILEILSRTNDGKTIACLAAGPLEDLIAHHGAHVIDRVETEARRNPNFRHLLGGVWSNTTPADIWSRVEAARVKAW